MELPLDLVLEILVKLLVKSLCRFRCVSKLWRLVIAGPRFIEAHRACSGDRPELLLLFPECGPLRGYSEEVVYHGYACKLGMPPDDPDLNEAYHELVPVENPTLWKGCISCQVGGLYCLDFSYFVRVWNPATRESFDIRTVESEADRGPGFRVINHFGFDPVGKKHKVLSILTKTASGEVIRSRVFILEDKLWRTAADVYPPRVTVAQITAAVFVDGVIFTPLGIKHGKPRLLAFHVGSERFQVISLPEAVERVKLIELAGRATWAGRPSLLRGGLPITLWMLEDLGQQVWRRKTCVIPDYMTDLTLHGGTPAGDLLFSGVCLWETFYLLLYNVESKTARQIKIGGLSEHTLKRVPYPIPVVQTARFHVESLQPPSFNISRDVQLEHVLFEGKQ